MEPASIILVFILVGFAAFFFAPLGLGGGLLFVPILHYVAGWEITPVTLLTSLILTAAVSWASGIKHRVEGLYDDDLTKMALYGAIPGALIGALLVNIMENNLDFAFKVVSLGMLAYAIIRMRNRLTLEEGSQGYGRVGKSRHDYAWFWIRWDDFSIFSGWRRCDIHPSFG